jgi:hypothetical protein
MSEEEISILKEAEIQETPTIYNTLSKIGNNNVHQTNDQSSYFNKAFTE